MKHLMALCLGLLTLVMTLSGCQSEEKGPAGLPFEVYFPVRHNHFVEAALESETHDIPEDGEPVRELLRLLLAGPQEETLYAVIPSDVKVESWTMEEDVLYVDFSRPYGTLSGIELTLADYSVTMTLSQIPGVSAVVTMVAGYPITYRDHQRLEADDILLSIYRNEPELRSVTLYFPRADGSGLGQEEREILLAEDGALAMAVLLSLAQGPLDEALAPVLEEEMIRSVEVQNEVCQLDLLPLFLETAAGDEPADQLVIAALVQTLCELETVSRVTFLIEGEKLQRYGAAEFTEPLEYEGSIKAKAQAHPEAVG